MEFPQVAPPEKKEPPRKIENLYVMVMPKGGKMMMVKKTPITTDRDNDFIKFFN